MKVQIDKHECLTVKKAITEKAQLGKVVELSIC